MVERDARLSEAKITSNLNTSLTKPVTTRTVRNHLKEPDFEYAAKVKKQWLSVKRRQKRVTWCKQYMHRTHDDGKNVIFSNESMFYVLKTVESVKNLAAGKRNAVAEIFTANKY